MAIASNKYSLCWFMVHPRAAMVLRLLKEVPWRSEERRGLARENKPKP